MALGQLCPAWAISAHQKDKEETENIQTVKGDVTEEVSTKFLEQKLKRRFDCCISPRSTSGRKSSSPV